MKKNKGFTLIELLAVIIILAVIALIAVPITLNIVKEAKRKSNLLTAKSLESAARLYSAEAMFDVNKKEKINNILDIYPEIILQGNKPEEGKLYITKEGKIAFSVIIDNECYIKHFNTDIEIQEKDSCDLGFVGIDEDAPLINFSIEGTIGNNDWYTSIAKININLIDNASGPSKLKWCIGVDCDPSNEEIGSSKQIELNNTEGTMVCVIGYDNYDNSSEKICTQVIKVDTIAPILTVNNTNNTIVQGDSVSVSSYFTPTYSISGTGTMSCSPNNTSSLSIGNQTVRCTATGNNGLSVSSTKTITVQAPYTGIPSKTYTPGSTIDYAGLKWKVIKDNGNSTTLVLASNYATGSYGTNTNWSTATVKNTVNTTFVNANAIIKRDIEKGGILYDSTSSSYVRLPQKTEVSSKISNDSNTLFWTMTVENDNIWYATKDGEFKLQNVTEQTKSVYSNYSEPSSSCSTIQKSIKTCTTNEMDTKTSANSSKVTIKKQTDYKREYYSTVCSTSTFGQNSYYINYCSPSGITGTWITFATAFPREYASTSSCEQYTICTVGTEDLPIGIRPVITVMEK